MVFDTELVGKIGSIALINRENNDLDYNIFSRISKELKPGFVWVTSGAVEIGRLDFMKRNGYELEGDREDIKTDYSAQGQSVLMNTYREFIDPKYSVRQILVEHNHFNDASNREHLKNMILRCKNQNAIPIINYNDAVSCEENRKWEIEELKHRSKKVVECVDNDETASQIALLVKAETLLILSCMDGIYHDVKDNGSLIKEISGATPYEVVDNVTEIQKLCSGASRKGANGAKAKLEYIKEPILQGTTVIIANSKYSIKKILEGSVPRTYIGVR